jgi:hypothetical protein
MEEAIKVLEFATSQEAWLDLNKYFLNNSKEIIKRGGGRYGPQLISHDLFIKIRKAWVDPEMDFGNLFGYRRQKWSSLVNNYVNLDFLDILKSEVLTKEKKRTPSYNLSMQFDNSHGSGKNCLLSLTVSKRVSYDHVIMTFNLRSSEITKRLLWDLLLVQRIAEYIFGDKEHISINLFCGNMYQNTESFIMMDNHVKIKKMLKPIGYKPGDDDKPVYDQWQKRTIDTLKEFKNVDHKTVKYKVHLRSVNQLQGLKGDRPLLAKHCHIVDIDDTPYPDDCITLKDRKKFKSQYRKNGRK